MERNRDITVVIPTTCEPARRSTLERAVFSLLNQEIGAPSILVVANGPRVDAGVLSAIKKLSMVRTLELDEGSLPRAIAVGRSAVSTPYFGFLDDDDEYLPNALDLRLRALEQFPDAAAAATDGYEWRDGVDHLRETVTATALRDPLRGLLAANWLASCSALFRSTLVTPQFFDGVTRYFEWTLLAYKIAARHRIVLLDTPTYRLYESVGSLSKSEAYKLAAPEVLKTVADLELPRDVRNALRDRVGRAYHTASSYFLREGRRGEAWTAHLQSLRWPGGLRYLAYTLKLFGPRA